MVKAAALLVSFAATIKSLWYGGSPFAGFTALWPTDADGKWSIQAEGIRLVFTNANGGAPTNLFINDTNGNEIDLILGLDNPKEYANYVGQLGGTIGRMAGHISNASFVINDKKYHTSANGNNGTSTYNGGVGGWERTTFDVGSRTSNSITFVVFDRAGKNGFPGNSGSALTHSVYPYEWRISYGVTPTRTSDPVPINLSHKTFWNLDGFREGSETIKEHRLHLPFSGLRLEEDQDQIPTGNIKGNTKDSEYDFWSLPRSLDVGLARKGSYDDLFLVNRHQPWEMDSNPVASLSSVKSGITLNMYTDQAAVRLVTWDKPYSNLALKAAQGGAKVGKNAAISMQMMDWPDALHHPEWQRESRILYGPDRMMTSVSKFKFSVKGRTSCH
ncbi:Glycoside hydrolase-type carbohydrate-binding, subgroup [Metarhizium brunneum]